TRDQHGVVRPVVTRHYDSLRAAAEENGRSRIYLGVHWEFDNQFGQAEGRGIANAVFHAAAEPVLTVAQPFLNQLYHDVLPRRADGAGLLSWTPLLEQGASRSAVVRAIENSVECHRGVVNDRFQALLHRDADAVGMQVFSDFLARGGTTDGLDALIMGSR